MDSTFAKIKKTLIGDRAFYAAVLAIIIPVMIPGMISGITTFINALNGGQPRSCAAS